MMLPARLFGKGISFPPRIGEDGRWQCSDGPENIREGIRVILATEPGERLMLRGFGSGLRRFLFAANHPATHRLVQESIEQGLRTWEPRIRVQSVAVQAHPEDRQSAVATIQYRLVADGAVESMRMVLNLGG